MKGACTRQKFPDATSPTHIFSSIFGCTELIIGASKANVCREPFGKVRFNRAPQKSRKGASMRALEPERFASNIFLASQMKVWELSETPFGEASGQSQSWSTGKRPFKLPEKRARKPA